jgi:hypothetical protein
MSREDLARRQAALVAALVAGASPPPGFDETMVAATSSAVMRKRAEEVAAVWPILRASLSPQWNNAFAAWAAGRPTAGALRDGWDFARSIAAAGGLSIAAAEELAEREVAWRYDGVSRPRRRRMPAVRRCPRGFTVQFRGYVRTVRSRRRHVGL